MFVSYLQKADQQILQLFNLIPLPKTVVNIGVPVSQFCLRIYLVAPKAKYAQRPSHLESQCPRNIFFSCSKKWVTWGEVQTVHVRNSDLCSWTISIRNQITWCGISGGIWKRSWHVYIEAVWDTFNVLEIQVMFKLIFL